MPNYDQLRLEMVEQQLIARDIVNQRVLDAMRYVPRHEFIPEDLRHLAYADHPVQIGNAQTISQPYIVALMLQLMQLSGHEIVLEIGTGSGYQTALLSQLARHVYTIERHDELTNQASQVLHALEVDNISMHRGDGSQGLPDRAPFDAITVGACVPTVPLPLKEQLHPQNGRLIIPVQDGRERQQQVLQFIRRDVNQWHSQNVLRVRFVPLIGQYGFSD